jgi:hypothetical protein
MIIFSWTLTPNQIIALRAIADHHRRYQLAAERKDRELIANNPLCPPGMAHWIGAVRHLCKEGFVSHKEVPLKTWERGIARHGIKNRQAWEITEKGKLILQLVSILKLRTLAECFRKTEHRSSYSRLREPFHTSIQKATTDTCRSHPLSYSRSATTKIHRTYLRTMSPVGNPVL